jgi:NAD-dependent dihydropyrimidine dehydrogenase PreA subunit
MAYVIYTDRCSLCGSCEEECPLQAIIREGDAYVIDPEICTECGYCADICPEQAIRGQ